MIPVQSSNIKAVEYSEKKKELVVLFKSGVKYSYEDVPLSVYEDFIEADSKGRFFSTFIKNEYSYEKL